MKKFLGLEGDLGKGPASTMFRLQGREGRGQLRRSLRNDLRVEGPWPAARPEQPLSQWRPDVSVFLVLTGQAEARSLWSGDRHAAPTQLSGCYCSRCWWSPISWLPTLIQTYIAQGVNGIAIAPLSQDASIPNLKDAASKGIQVAITNMNLAGDTAFLAGGYTSDDATNGKIVGTNAAEFIKANLKGDVNIAQVDFDDQVPEQSKARWSGFFSGLDEAGVKYNKVATVSSHVQDDALTKVTDMLTAHPEINVIWACNDGGTIGAAMAVKQAGLEGKVFVFGYDGGDQQTSMILSSDKILQGVVSQDPYTQGYKAVESLALTLQGKTNPDKGKITVVPGMYLSSTDPAGVNAWRKANGLPEITTSKPLPKESTHHRRCGIPGRSVHEEHGPGL